ncbi:MAG: NUDIX domain-containing protein [Verrucomicrobiota bacterium]
MEDIFDIVNEKDEVIGDAPRSIIHQKRHLHRATHMLIYNNTGQILLQLRSKEKDRHPNKWDSSASGHVDRGEDYFTAAIRETIEELGISPAPDFKEIAYIQVTPQTDNEFVKLYLGHHLGPFKPCPNEIKKVQWFTPNDISELIHRHPTKCAPAFSFIWQTYREKILKEMES